VTAVDTPLQRVYRFNRRFPPGTPVLFWPGCREGAGRESTTTGTAWLLGGHTPVVRVADHSSAIALTHVQPVPTTAGQEEVPGADRT
jgi:hypothetical protein